MKKSLTISLFISLLFILINPTSAQQPYAFLFSGELLDLNENPIANKNAVAILEFSDAKSSLYRSEEPILTNGTGKFLLVLKDIPEIFSDYKEQERIEILITLTSDEDWLEGGLLSTKYFLNKIHNQPGLSEDSIMAPPQFEMSRFDGQILNTSTLKDIYKFADNYSFSYMKSNFMMSLNPEIIDPGSIILTTIEADKSTSKPDQNDSIKSRGIKGGYAVGGYNKEAKKKKDYEPPTLSLYLL